MGALEGDRLKEVFAVAWLYVCMRSYGHVVETMGLMLYIRSSSCLPGFVHYAVSKDRLNFCISSNLFGFVLLLIWYDLTWWIVDMFGSLLQIRAGSHENCEIHEHAMIGLESLKVIILAGILRRLDGEGVGNMFGKPWKLMCLNCED